MKKLSLLTKRSLLAVSIASLMACSGDENQDSSAPPPDNSPVMVDDQSVVITGLAMNGYLANALVWIDLRDNGAPDGFEPIAYTDNQGYVSYNPVTGINYCDSNEASLQKFCLKTGVQSGELVVKAAQGIELLSGEVFRSVLTASTSVEQAKTNLVDLTNLGPKPLGDSSLWQAQLDQSQLKLSAFSSLKHYLPNTTSLSDAINELGFSLSNDVSDSDILANDFIANLSNSNADAATLFAADVALSRMVDTIASNLDEVAKDLDLGTSGLPISSADSIYATLANSLSPTGTNLRSNLSETSNMSPVNTKLAALQELSESDIAALISAAATQFINALLEQNTLSSGVQTRLNNVANNVYLQRQVANIPLTSKQHFQRLDLNNNLVNDLLGLYHTVTLPTLYEPVGLASASRAAIIAAISDFIRDPNNQISQRLINAARSNNSDTLSPLFDLISFVNDLFDIARQADSIEAIQAFLESEENDAEVTELAEVDTVDDSSFWAGNKISMSGIQESRSSGNVEQGQIIAFFKGEPQDNSGELVLCVAYENQDDPSDNIKGQLFEGTWTILGSSVQNRLSLVAEGFNVQMKVLGETLGRDILDDQQVQSLPRNPNELYGKFSFTLNEDTATWHSDDASVNQSFGLMPVDSVPSTSDACKAAITLDVE